MIEIFPYAVLIMFASLVGVFSVWRRAGRVVERHLSLLVSFSAGVFLVIAYQLGIEALEHSNTFRFGLLWIIVGVLAVWLLFKFLPSSHHHHDETLETHPHSRLDARRIVVSDALHNLGDGIFLAASFAAGSSLGIVAALSIFCPPTSRLLGKVGSCLKFRHFRHDSSRRAGRFLFVRKF